LHAALSRRLACPFLKGVAGKVEQEDVRETAGGIDGLNATRLPAGAAFNAGSLINIGPIINKPDCQPWAQVYT